MAFLPGNYISNQLTLAQKRAAQLNDYVRPSTYRRLFKRLPKRSRKRAIRYGLLVANLIILMGVTLFVVNGGNSGADTINAASTLGESAATINPLDQLSSADIAVQIARTTNLGEAQAVANNADTINAKLAVSSDSQTVVAKPQIINAGLKSRKDIQNYTVKPGDTVSSIAAQFGITSDTIRWSNALSGDSVPVGKILVISPVNGIVYRVKAGDTADSIAAKYHANKSLLIAINDAEIHGLPAAGQYIIIPGGTLPTAVTAPTVAFGAYGGGFAWGGGGAIYNGNGYDLGNCTWWAAFRRAQIGRPIPSNLGNASTWKVLAQQAGLGVGSSPAAGAIIWFTPRDYYGHVGFVESVNGDGSVNISEMNVYGWNVVSRRTIAASDAHNYSYIY